MKNHITIDQLEVLMASKEGEHLEFKEARNRFDFETLVKYCSALANEGGGNIVLGVTDKRPRSVVDSQAFKQPERTRQGLIAYFSLSGTPIQFVPAPHYGFIRHFVIGAKRRSSKISKVPDGPRKTHHFEHTLFH